MESPTVPSPNDPPASTKVPVPTTNGDNAAPTSGTTSDAVTPTSVAPTTTTATTNGDKVAPSGTTTSDATATTATARVLTYDSSRASTAYERGEELLSSGDFAGALVVLGDALAATLSLVNQQDARIGYTDICEAAGPFQHLYGSTLLFRLEENRCDGEDGVRLVRGDGSEDDRDAEVAWENLESAKTTLERLCDKDTATDDYRDDLARTRQRLGDLRRLRGDHDGALEDYEAALQLQAEVYGEHHRAVADCHYVLGMTCLLAAAGKEDDDEEDEDEDDDEEVEDVANFRRRQLLSRRALMHYRDCARIVGYQIGQLCGVDLTDLLTDEETNEDRTEDDSSSLLVKIRDRVGDLTESNSADCVAVYSMKELLEEIQTTVDSVTELNDSDRAFQEAAGLAAAAEDAINVDQPDDLQETITSRDPSDLLDTLQETITSRDPSDPLDALQETVPRKRVPIDDDDDDDDCRPVDDLQVSTRRRTIPLDEDDGGPSEGRNVTTMTSKTMVTLPSHRARGTLCRQNSMCEQCVIQ